MIFCQKATKKSHKTRCEIESIRFEIQKEYLLINRLYVQKVLYPTLELK